MALLFPHVPVDRVRAVVGPAWMTYLDALGRDYVPLRVRPRAQWDLCALVAYQHREVRKR